MPISLNTKKMELAMFTLSKKHLDYELKTRNKA